MLGMMMAAIGSFQYNKDMNKIKELEEKLDRYYREREQRLMKHKKD